MTKLSLIIVPIFLLLLCLPFLTFGCFSSGDPAERRHPPESAKLRRAEQQHTLVDNAVVASAEKDEPEFEVDGRFIRDYLREFGHLAPNREKDIGSGIKHFQEFLGLKSSGRMDLRTLARMSWKRCSAPDQGYTSAPQIWERTTLFWHVQRPLPDGFSFGQQDMKELIRQAFTAWEIVIAMEFLETQNPAEAQIIFGIADDGAVHNGTGLGIASAGGPPLSRIWLNRHENWSTFQTQEEGKIDIFLVLIHEIGHSLGLHHSGDEQSVMFPMFERAVGDQLPVISNDDVERLRALYEATELPTAIDSAKDGHGHGQQPKPAPAPPRSPPQQQSVVAQNPPQTASSIDAGNVKEAEDGQEKCPHSIWAATNVLPSVNPADTLYLFNGPNTWLLKQGKIVDGPKPINEVFPDGPDEVDVAFSTGRLTLLMKGRTVFGYEWDQEQNKFKRARGFPRELHNRILFTPEAAFPIANGSIILIKDKVFATYNAENNTPHMLGSVDEFFPNLPEGLKAGFPASADFSLYHMLTKEYAFLYDVRLSRSVGSQSMGQFLGCDPSSSPAKAPLAPPQQPIGPRPPLGPTRNSQQGESTSQQQQPTGTMIHGQGPPGFAGSAQAQGSTSGHRFR